MALLWIWVFAKKKGLLTKLASNPVMVALGNISPQAFLIHFAIIATVNAYMALHGIIFTKDMIWKFAPVEFIVTIIVCVLYKKVSSILFKKAL
jgi:peptidoglycan/LPS O-acetylase OafA/YrhL